MNFIDLGIREDLCNVCKNIGWENPTDIQKSSIPTALTGVDIIGLAETGGGKTGAFLLPILNDWLNKDKPVMFALILTPTRELGAQIEQQLLQLGSEFGLHTTLLIGGDELSDQLIALGQWKSHVVIATPGRVVALVAKSRPARTMLETVPHLVIDEADRMLQLEFESDMEAIMRLLPARNSFSNRDRLKRGRLNCLRRTQLFSATFEGARIDKLANQLLYQPVRITAANSLQIPVGLSQFVLICQYADRVPTLFGLLRHYLARKVPARTGQAGDAPQQDKESVEIRSAIVFVTTCKQTKPLETYLNGMGASAVALHSQLTQAQRERALSQFRDGEATVLVATDIASRGLDVSHVVLVVNLDLPQNTDWYKHRVGRTARAGKTGVAVTIVTEINKVEFIGMEKRLKLGQIAAHAPIVLGKLDRARSALVLKEARKRARQDEESRVLDGVDTDFATSINKNFSTKRQKLDEKQKKLRPNK